MSDSTRDFSEDSEVHASMNLTLNPMAISCGSSCMRKVSRKPIHLTDEKISEFTKTLKKEGESQELSSKKFKMHLLELLGQDQEKYKLICIASGIDSEFDKGLVTMADVFKIKKIFLDVFQLEVFKLEE